MTSVANAGVKGKLLFMLERLYIDGTQRLPKRVISKTSWMIAISI